MKMIINGLYDNYLKQLIISKNKKMKIYPKIVFKAIINI